MRAGCIALSLLADARVIKALSAGPLTLVQLRKAIGTPPPTTLRLHLRNLARPGVVLRHQSPGFHRVVAYELGDHGTNLLEAAACLEDWLMRGPEGEVPLGGQEARSVIQALSEGWDTSIVRALVAKPLSLTELDRLIADVNYPALERRVSSMRAVGLIEPDLTGGRSTRYVVTRWLREAAAPLLAAVTWEEVFETQSSSRIQSVDAEGILLLCAPLLSCPESAAGTCRLAFTSPIAARTSPPSGVVLCVKEGRLLACGSDRRRDAPTRAIGTPDSWMSALRDGYMDRMEISGNMMLATSVVGCLGRALFGGSAKGRWSNAIALGARS